MLTVDKIKNYVPEQIINTINECVNLQDIDTLRKWLIDCKQEIQRREANKEDISFLFYEKAYLEMVFIPLVHQTYGGF